MRWLLAVILCLGLCVDASAERISPSLPATPPEQPKSGPGGSDYLYKDMRVTLYGQGAGAYYIAQPIGEIDKPLPVVVFVHGMALTRYTAYSAWIKHLVRRGNVVIYPVYHTSGIVDPTTFTAAVASNTIKAIGKCDGKRHAAIDTTRLTMIGHSLGGTIIANLAARPKHFKLPAPKALMLLQPGDTKADKGLGAFFPSLTGDHAGIALSTLMLIVDVENDYFVSPKAGQRIYDNASAIARKDKRRLLLKTDDHGKPPIEADHMLPMAWTRSQKSNGRINAYDYAAWRWFDALQATALGDEKHRSLVFGEAALDLGEWSDGTPVRRPIDASAGRLEP